MQELLNELSEFKKMLVANTITDFEFENNANEEFSEMATQLQALIDKYTKTDTQIMCEALADMICDDEDEYANMEEALNLLIKQSEIDGSVMADDIVMMWEPLVNRFTVNELLAQL
jgi:hypothetical protein